MRAIFKPSLYLEENINPARLGSIMGNNDWIVNPDLSSVEGIEQKYWKVSGNDIIEMNQSEKDSVDSHKVDLARDKRMKETDVTTQSLIDNGFTFDGETFSLSTGAQFNWNAIKVAVDGGLLVEGNFPYGISTKTETEYNLSWADVNSFIGTVLVTVSTHLGGGRAIKQGLIAATSISGLDAIVDNR